MDAMKVIINLNRCKDGDCDHCDYKRLFYPNSFDDGKEVCEWGRLANDTRALISWLESMLESMLSAGERMNTTGDDNMAADYREYCEHFEQTYNPEDGSM